MGTQGVWALTEAELVSGNQFIQTDICRTALHTSNLSKPDTGGTVKFYWI